MPPRTIQYSFAHGECSAEFLGGRQDVNRYYDSCRVLENFLPLLTGGIFRATGTRFMARTKENGPARLQRFEFSIEQAYMLEIGVGYIRIYKDDGRLISEAGTPIEVVTPYQAADLFQVQCIQSNDVMWFVHPAYPVHTLSRFAEDDWRFDLFNMRPAPSIEEDFAPAATLTPSALTGVVTLTASAAVFFEADRNRQIRSRTALATITNLIGTAPTTQVRARVHWAFASLEPIAAGEWFLVGSPVANLTTSQTGPIGGTTILTLSDGGRGNPNLLRFDQWDDLSGPTLVAGICTGGDASTLIDSAPFINFLERGVEAGHRVIRVAGGEGRADRVTQTVNPSDTVVMEPGLTSPFAFSAGDQYQVRETGTFASREGQLILSPGENGLSWGQQRVDVVEGMVYEIAFTVQSAAITVRVGTLSAASNLFEERSFAPGSHTLQFIARDIAAYVQFRNSQSPLNAQVTGVRMQLISIAGWREADLGSFVTLFGGTVELTEILDPTRAEGVIWWPIEPPTEPEGSEGDPTPTAIAGNWALQRPAWSEERGFPRTASFFQGRLGFGGSPILGVWLSVNGLYDNFALGPNDDQAVFVSLNANRMNAIEWMEPLRDLLVGTRGTEHVIRGGPVGITPSATEQVPLPTENGSNPLRPMRMGTVLYQLGRGGRNIYEVQLDAAQNQVTDVRDLLTDARHITESGIVQWALQNKPIKRLWMVRRDGQVVCFTADIYEDVRGFARRTTQGRVLSIETVPIDQPIAHEMTETVWWIADRNGLKCIERMEPGLTLDSALSYSGPPVQTVSGLAHLEGLQVGVLRDGAHERHLVKDGAVTLDRPGSEITVGLEYVATLGLPRPELALRDGTLQTLKKHIVQASVRVINAMGLTVNGETIPFRRTFDLMDTAPPAQDLDISVALRGWSQDGQITITQPLPFPLTILSVVLELEFEETS